MSEFEIKIAESEEEKISAFRLRFEVFKKELESSEDALGLGETETDIYDRFCDHLIITDKKNNLVVGTYRLLPGSKVDPEIGFYAEKIFNIDNIKKLNRIMELGRSCVHKDYRDKPIISMLWKGIAGYMQENDIRYLFGSVRLHTCQPREVNEYFSFLKNKYYSQDKYRVWPLKENVFDALDDTVIPSRGEKIFLELPPLLKGYLKLGMKICSEPAWDLHLKSIVFFILLDMDTMPGPYKRHFFNR